MEIRHPDSGAELLIYHIRRFARVTSGRNFAILSSSFGLNGLEFNFSIQRKKSDLEFWLKPRLNKSGILYTTIFDIVILMYVLISYIVGYSLNTIVPYAYELNISNVLGTLGFQLFLSGTSEEILFRALPITVLGGVIGKDKKGYAFIIVIASVLFSAAHIQWTLFPVSLTFSWFQLIYAFILGIAYGLTYVKSESIIYPMIMHGLSNFFMVGMGYIFMTLMN